MQQQGDGKESPPAGVVWGETRQQTLGGSMRGRLALAVAAVGAGAVLVPVAASGQYGYTQPGSPQPGQQAGATQPGATQVYAEGNFANPSALKFDPPEVMVTVGSTVRWTNTDNAVPHTATED